MRYNQWRFGNKAGVDFSGSNPFSVQASSIDTYEGCSSICDELGNLILYTDGVTVWDENGVSRATGLSGSSSSTQSGIIVPDPASQNRYYVFTTDGESGAEKHVDGIRITLGSWQVEPLSSLMTMPPEACYSPTERLAAVRHSNEQDYWIMTIVQVGQPANLSAAPAILRLFKVSANGVMWVSDQSLDQNMGDIGHLKVSTRGRRIGVADFWHNHVYVYDFSSTTGVVDASRKISIEVRVPPHNTIGKPYGLEFSASGRLLYYSTLFPLPIAVSPVSNGHVFQKILTNSNAPVLVGTHANDKAGDYALGALQLSPDKEKIYVAQDGEQLLGAINYPDIPGTGCDLVFNDLHLANTSVCNAGLPNMVRDLY